MIEGRILGHEGIGVIDEVATAASAFRNGDKVLISCITTWGKCVFCREHMYSHCPYAGWILGNIIDGTRRNTYASRMPTRVTSPSRFLSTTCIR